MKAEVKKSDKILEPSAGQGAIVNAIIKHLPNNIIDCCELMDINRNVLSNNKNVNLICEDFLKIPKEFKNYYDCIIANSPFNKNQDIEHIMKMYECLKQGGRLVTIASKHWKTSSRKKENLFKNWVDDLGGSVKNIESGAFKESGTNIATCMIIINKN